MNRPDNIEIYEDIDLKLGIKSSLPDVKATIALLILLFESNDRPAELEYSEQNGDNIVIPQKLLENLKEFISLNVMDFNIELEILRENINSNRLYTSQLEALIVAFELIWKMAIVKFSDSKMPYSTERTGGKRYPKKLCFSLNMDIIHNLISCNYEKYIRVFLSWMGITTANSQEDEKHLISLLQAITELAIYKLDDNGKSVIFNQNSIYKKIIEVENSVDINGDKESKGSLRILKSALQEGLNPYLSYTNGRVTKNSVTLENFEAYQKRVENYLRLSATKLIREDSTTRSGISNDTSQGREKGGKNILLYGVPGSGKSHTIKTQYCDDESKIERIVFHPDYMNTDFIGQILPTIEENGKVSYEFSPGPFTKILKKAYENPKSMYYLIIEEINRGNAPAIFGEVFQLLDRDNEGNSSYCISNNNVSEIVYGNSEQSVSLPSNLYILATMNTADQNVFTLDTAFQRRWIMRMIKNDIEKAQHADMEILDTGVTWQIFAETVNNQIISSNSATMSSEDKRLGAYFITEETLIEDKENMNQTGFNCLFAEKVIKYLWDDAFKFGRDKLFNPEYKSLERVIEEFSNNKGFNRFDIFETSIKDLIAEKKQVHEGLKTINLTEPNTNLEE